MVKHRIGEKNFAGLLVERMHNATASVLFVHFHRAGSLDGSFLLFSAGPAKAGPPKCAHSTPTGSVQSLEVFLRLCMSVHH